MLHHKYAWKQYLLLFFYISNTAVYSQLGGLPELESVALDIGRGVKDGTLAMAMYAKFKSVNPIYAQLWVNTSQKNVYLLKWQIYAKPSFGNGSAEVFNFNSTQQITLTSSMRVGIVNEKLPGPLVETSEFGGGVVISNQKYLKETLPIKIGTSLQFDSLSLPYHIPIVFCNTTDCPYELGKKIDKPETEEVVDKNDADKLSVLQSKGIILTLFIWNTTITIILISLIVGLLYYLDRRKKKKKLMNKQLQAYMGPAFSLSGEESPLPDNTIDINNYLNNSSINFDNCSTMNATSTIRYSNCSTPTEARKSPELDYAKDCKQSPALSF